MLIELSVNVSKLMVTSRSVSSALVGTSKLKRINLAAISKLIFLQGNSVSEV